MPVLQMKTWLWTAAVLTILAGIAYITSRAFEKVSTNNSAFAEARGLVANLRSHVKHREMRSLIVEDLEGVQLDSKCFAIDENYNLWWSSYEDDAAKKDGVRPGMRMSTVENQLEHLMNAAKIGRVQPFVLEIGSEVHVAYGERLAHDLVLVCAVKL
jgi:hypothetical protein